MILCVHVVSGLSVIWTLFLLSWFISGSFFVLWIPSDFERSSVGIDSQSVCTWYVYEMFCYLPFLSNWYTVHLTLRSLLVVIFPYPDLLFHSTKISLFFPSCIALSFKNVPDLQFIPQFLLCLFILLYLLPCLVCHWEPERLLNICHSCKC